MIALKQPITKETFIFEIFFHISLARSFSYSLFFNTTSLFSKLKVQNILYFKVSSKHTRNNCGQFPFEGEFFDNVFVHFFPNVYTFQELEEKLQSLSNWEIVADIGQIHP